MSELFGVYWTKKFTDIYGSVDKFTVDYTSCAIPTTITEESARTLYYLLYANYGNSHIRNMDENQFKYKLFSTIFMYGPIWEKRLEIQNKLRSLSEEEVLRGTAAIYNRALNDGSNPAQKSLSLHEIDHINEQNTTNYRKGKMEGYTQLYDIIDQDVTKKFLGYFKKLFLTIVEPQAPLLYKTESEED